MTIQDDQEKLLRRAIEERIFNCSQKTMVVPAWAFPSFPIYSNISDEFLIRISTYINGLFKPEGMIATRGFKTAQEAIDITIANFILSNVKIYEDESDTTRDKTMVVIWRLMPEIRDIDGLWHTRMRLGIGRI